MNDDLVMRNTIKANEELLATIVEFIIASEGGYVNHDADRGLATNYGISSLTWSDYVDKHKHLSVTLPKTVRGITRDIATVYYHDRFRASGIWRLPPDLWYVVFDFEVNAGRNAIEELQKLIVIQMNPTDLDIDGILGPMTEGYVAGYCSEWTVRRLVYELTKRRLGYYVDLVLLDHSQEVFLRGWTKRTVDVLEKCYKLRQLSLIS